VNQSPPRAGAPRGWEIVDPGADLRGRLRGTSCLEKTEGGANDSAEVP
jgi:hypothetical protein